MAVLAVVAWPLPLCAAIDHSEDLDWAIAQARAGYFPFVEAEAPVVVTRWADAVVTPAQAEPATVAAPSTDAADSPVAQAFGHELSVTERLQDWLARANREFQTKVIKRLSVPAAGSDSDDEIARKLEEVKAQDRKAAEAKRIEDERRAAETKQAEEARRQAEAKQKEEARRQEQARREEEAKRQEDARQAATKAEAEAAAAVAKKAAEETATPAPEPPPAAKPDDSARLAEEMRQERARLEAEADRIETQRKAAEAKRIADERAADDARVADMRAKEEARVAEERRKAEQQESDKHRTRTIVLTPEPIPRPAAELVPRPIVRAPVIADAAPGPAASDRGSSIKLARGPVVKRWIWRVRDARCRLAGRRIVPPGRYTVGHGDSLWLISKRHYRTGWLWRKIYRANRGIIHDPNLIYPCQRIYVPRRR